MLSDSQPAVAATVDSRRRIKLVFIIGALSAFGPLSIDMYLPGLPSLTKDLGGLDWQAQLTLTACLLGLAGGQVVAGPLSDAMGRYRPLLIGLAGYTIASLLCALAPSVPVLIVLRLIQGLAGAAGLVISRAIVRDLFSGADVAKFFALTMAVSGFAPILAPVIGGQLLNFTTWRGVFVLLTIIGAGLFLMAWFGLSESLPLERRRTGGIKATFSAFSMLLGDIRFVGYALSSGLAFAAMFAYISGSPFVLENIYKVSPQLFSLIFATNALGIISASQISGRLVNKVNPQTLLRIGLTLSLLGGVILFASVWIGNIGLVGILPGFFLLVSSIGLIGPNSTALALSDHSKIAGSASALLGVLQYIIGAIVTPLVSVGGSSSAQPLALIIGVLSLAAFLTFLLMANSKPKAI